MSSSSAERFINCQISIKDTVYYNIPHKYLLRILCFPPIFICFQSGRACSGVLFLALSKFTILFAHCISPILPAAFLRN